MKTLPLIIVLAAVSAFVLFPVNFETAASVVFTLGFASILISDYSHRLRLVQSQARRVPVGPPAERPSTSSALGLAA